MILVSSCLLDLFSRYDGVTNANKLLMGYSHLGKYIPVCPEQMGGLPTPRRPVEILGKSGLSVLSGTGKVVTADGQDCSVEFVRGAQQVLKLIKTFPIKGAVLKERSPSCGSTFIYDGTFSHTVISGEGITASLLRQHGIPVYSEETITKKILEELLADK